MPQHRELGPVTVYLPPDVRQEAVKRAGELGLAIATLLRLILIGKQPPLR